MIRVLVIDDLELFRVCLRLGLEKFPDIRLAYEAADGPTGIAIAGERRPDVAIVDLRLEDADGVEIARQVQRVSPSTKIILISGFVDDLILAKGMGLGFGAIVEKSEPTERLAAYIRRIHAGEPITLETANA